MPDPTAQSSQGSTSLTLANADGTLAGYVLYDGYGGVLTATLPAALTAQGVIADPDTGLVYLGDGRYYDPVLGRPLQPNPAGGPPTVPQTLNRYAATSLGQPGVAEGMANSINSIPYIAGFGKTLAIEVAAKYKLGFFGLDIANYAYRYAGKTTIAFQASAPSLTANRAVIEATGGTFVESIEDTPRLLASGKGYSKLKYRMDVFRYEVGFG